MFGNLKLFFAEAKSEFKKISWPSWDEIKGSTAVVCVTILFLMAVLWIYDTGIVGVTVLWGKIFK
jgi:preprotein translocase SecE subunit